MPTFTEDDLKAVEGFLAANPTGSGTSEGEGDSAWGRAGKQLLNLPSNILQSFADTGTAVANLGAGPTPFENLNVFKPAHIPEDGQHPYVDIGLGHLVPELAASSVPFAGAAKVAKLAGAGEVAADVIGSAAAGAFTGIKSGPEEALRQAAVYAGLTGLGVISPLKRVLPLAGLAGADAGLTYAQTGDPHAAATTAGMDVGFGYLPDVVKLVLNRFKSPVEDATARFPMNRALDYQAPQQEIPQLQYPGYSDRVNFQNLGSTSSDVIEGQFRELHPDDPARLIYSPEQQFLSLRNDFRDSPPLQDQPRPDIQLFDPQPKPPVDDFFRLIEPPVAPADVPVYPPGQELQLIDEISNKRDLDKIKSQLSKPRAKRTKVGPTVVEEPQQSIVRVRTPQGAVDATVNSFQDGVFHVTIDDPIHGTRLASVSEFDNNGERQVFPKVEAPPTPKGGVPFRDVKSLDVPEAEAENIFTEGTEQVGGLDAFAKREREAANKGMKKRTKPGEFGGIIPEFLTKPSIGFPVLGAVAGGVQGDTPEEHILNAFKGVALGMAGAKGYGWLERMNEAFLRAGRESGSIGGNPRKRVAIPALLFKDGTVYSRPDAVGHWDLINDFPEEATLVKGGPDEPFERGFVKADTGEWMDRQAAHKLATEVSPAYRQYIKEENIDDGILDSTDLSTIETDPNRIGMQKNKGQTGALDIFNQPFRTNFEEKAVEDKATGRITKIGNRDVGKEGWINLNGFKKASGISDHELKAYQLHYPEAFNGDQINVNSLRQGLESKPLLEVVNLPHEEGILSKFDEVRARLQHYVDSKYPGKVSITDETGEIWFNGESIEDFNNVPENLQQMLESDVELRGLIKDYNNEWESSNYGPPAQDRARSASAHYESHEINPRPLEELQKKEGYDQIVKIPTKMVKQTGGDILAVDDWESPEALHTSDHFNGDEARNQIGFTRGYADELPGKSGKHEIVYEYQGDWAQQRRKYFEEHPLIESPDKLPEGVEVGKYKYGSKAGHPEKEWFVQDGDDARGWVTYGATKEEAIANYNKRNLEGAPKDHPLLNDYKRQTLKARVDKAIEDGRDGIMLTDGDTVILTEGHDKFHEAIKEIPVKELRFNLAAASREPASNNADLFANVDKVGKAEYGDDWQNGRYLNYNGRTYRVDKPQANRPNWHEIAKELAPYKEGDYYIYTREGMKENYDRTGPAILEQLTGVKPEHISLGEGSHRAHENSYEMRGGEHEDTVWAKGSKQEMETLLENTIHPRAYRVVNGGSKALGGKSDISGWWFDLKPLRAKREAMGMKRSSLSGKSGFMSIHAAMTVAGAGIGAEEGYRQSHGDPNAALAGAVLGGAAGFMGYKALEALLRPNPRLNIQGEVSKTNLKGFKTEAEAAAAAVMSKTARDLGGEEVRGQGGIMAKFIAGMEFWGRMHMPESVKTAWTQSRGQGMLVVQQVRQALENLKGFKPPQNVLDAAAKFIEGRFLPEADAKRIINNGGGIPHATWETIDPKSKPAGYTMWDLGERGAKTSTGTRDTSNTYWIPESTKRQLIIEEEDAFKNLLGKPNEHYYDFIRIARRSLDELQSLYADGLVGNLKQVIQNSTGQYVTRAFKIHNDPNYRPTEAQIQNAMGDLGAFLGAKGHDFNEDYLRNQIEQYLQDHKANRAEWGITGGKSKLDTTLLKEREDLTPSFRELLGEYTDPKERLLQSIARVFPSAQASQFISLAHDIQIDGLKASYSRSEWVQESKRLHDIVDNLKGRSSLTTAEQELLRESQTKITRLNEFKEIPDNLKYGKFRDVFVNRFIADQLKGLDPNIAGLDNPVFRAMSNVNTWTKIIHTAYDPIRIMRNIITVPFFKSIGRAEWETMDQAFRAFKSKSGPIYRELIEQGILGADQVSAEFKGSLQDLFNGHYDSSLTQKLRGMNSNIMEFYRMPDAVTRAAVYLSAKSRYSAEMKLPIDHPDVIRRAVEWTDRRTINYENVSPFVRVARQIPFFNLYISYASEIARITKNLAVDAIGMGPTGKVDLRAMAQLGALAGGFEAIQAIAVANLSDKDQKDWKTANNLGQAYSRSRFKIPTGRDAKGNFSYIDLTPLIITDSYNQTIRSLVKGDTAAAIAANPIVGWDNSPVFNILNQFITGQDLHTKRELRNFGEYAGAVAKELSPTWTPGLGYEWQKVASIGQENVKTGRQENWPGTLMRYLTGLNVTSVNPSSVERQALAELKQNISNERAYLNDVLKMTNQSDTKKQRAVDTYQKAVQAAIAHYISQRNR